MARAPMLSRREWMKLAAAGFSGVSMSGWMETLAASMDTRKQKPPRACILLWMSGGPSQTDTFDLKPGHANGGPFKAIKTNAPGLEISEHLPKLAAFGDKMAVIRSMNTKEGDHGRATYLLRTGRAPGAGGPIHYPTLGSFVSKEIGREDCPLPNFVSVGPYRLFNPMAFGPGYLGPAHAPLLIGDNNGQIQAPGAQGIEEYLKVRDLTAPDGVGRDHQDARIGLLQGLDRDFAADRPGVAPRSHQMAYDRAVRLMRTEASKAFNIDEEKAAVRDAYGRNLFGQGCLLARRLVERGVAFVEVTLAGNNGNAFGWDTHGQNFDAVQRLSQILDPAWATLMSDLKDRGLLDTTLIVWMGEFGRTPKINPQAGRDHWATSWTTVLAGGGIKGGQAVGKTGAGGEAVEERPVSVADFLATVCAAQGIDHTKTNLSNVGRPITLVEKTATVIEEIVR